MNQYTTYCTAEQTRNALELGAPIRFASINDIRLGRYIEVESNNKVYEIPNTEQMIGWLEAQGIYINFDTTSEEDENHNLIITWQYFIYNHYHDIVNKEYIEYPSRKEVTIAAIDAAMEYLKNK